MLFLTTLDITEGKAEDMFYLIKKNRPPENIKVHEFLKLFGKPDFAIVFEAPTEQDAMDFILKFASCSISKTALCNPVEGYEGEKDE